jgi:hypothetical protein
LLDSGPKIKPIGERMQEFQSFQSSNGRDSSGFTCEGWAHEIDESDWHHEKHEEPRI